MLTPVEILGNNIKTTENGPFAKKPKTTSTLLN